MPPLTGHHNGTLLLSIVVSVVMLVILIARYKVHSFIALTLASLFVGLCSGMELPAIAKTFQEGVGAMLGSVAVIVGLGMILGKMLAESGGAEVIARRMIALFGKKKLNWAMVVIALIVGIPVWFSVGVVLLIPIVFTLAREAKVPLLYLGIPLVAGLSIAHGLFPPHPGPMAAIEVLKADVGKTIVYSLLIGVPTAILVGPLLGKFLASRVQVEIGGIAAQMLPKSQDPQRILPGFGLTLFTILLPILLMLLASGADLTLPKVDPVRQFIDFAGNPIVAMLAGVAFSFYSFGLGLGFDRRQISKFTEECLGPVAGLLLIVGAGGGFSRILVASGIGDSMAALAKTTHLSPMLFSWLVAALIRIATGSATVAISTAAGIMAPILAGMPGVNLELAIIAMGAGSSILSHLNDGGFWFVKEYFNMTVSQTLQTWTVMVTLKSLVELILVLLLDKLF